jgi:hypothetical protein
MPSGFNSANESSILSSSNYSMSESDYDLGDEDPEIKII